MSKLRGLSRRINKDKKQTFKMEKMLRVKNGYLKLTFPLTPEQFKVWDVFVDYMLSFANGDQKHGTNIEAPLSTIESALDNVLNRRGGTSGSMTLHNVMQVNRRVLYDEFIEEAKLRMSTTGRNPFDLA